MRKIFLLALLTIAFAAYSDNVKTLTGHAVYYGTPKEGPETCKQHALEAARIDALEKEFGRFISQDVTSIDALANGKETNFFQMLNNAEVKGEWLGDEGNPVFKTKYDEAEGGFTVECTVKIKARPFSNEAVDFTAEVMRNGMTVKHRDTHFRDGDLLYMEFMAPVSGYLMVFYATDDDSVYPLFPYMSNIEEPYKLKGNTTYVLFNQNDRTFGRSDGYCLRTSKDVEVNHLFIIFSPEKFSKPATRFYPDEGLYKMTFSDFNKWKAKTMGRDQKMSMKRISLSITKD